MSGSTCRTAGPVLWRQIAEHPAPSGLQRGPSAHRVPSPTPPWPACRAMSKNCRNPSAPRSGVTNTTAEGRRPDHSARGTASFAAPTRPARSRAWTPTVRWSCTPATAVNGRSRCCATDCCTSLPQTRRCSRATSLMCPNIEEFAPLITGAFGSTDAAERVWNHPATQLRVRLADRGLLATNDVLAVVARVIALGVGRVTVSDLLDLEAAAPVAWRFGFRRRPRQPRLLGTAREHPVGDRCGAARQVRSGRLPQGTAETGLSRMLLGVAADEADGQWLGTALPLGGIDSNDTDVVGRFAEFVDRLGSLLARFTGEQPAVSWADVLTDIVELLTLADRDSEWQRAQTVRLIRDSLTGGHALGPSDIRDLVEDLVGAAPTRSNFCTGELTVCTMVPMRSVPHRAIILLGMDAEAFPRTQAVDGDDILAVDPLVEERSRRDEDRQTFLDAITAAGEHLIICYTGADPITGMAVPPSVVVTELVDAITRGRGSRRRRADGAYARCTPSTTRTSRTPQPFSFDRALLSGARTLHRMTADQHTGTPWPTMAGTYPAAPPGDVDLTDLIAFVCNPADGFLRQRLGVMVPGSSKPRTINSPYASTVCRAGGGRSNPGRAPRRRGTGAGACRRVAPGTLPPFDLGQQTLRPIAEKAGGNRGPRRRGAPRTGAHRRHPRRPAGRAAPLRHRRQRLRRRVGRGHVFRAQASSACRRGLRCWRWPPVRPNLSGEACVIGGEGKGTGIRR